MPDASASSCVPSITRQQGNGFSQMSSAPEPPYPPRSYPPGGHAQPAALPARRARALPAAPSSGPESGELDDPTVERPAAPQAPQDDATGFRHQQDGYYGPATPVSGTQNAGHWFSRAVGPGYPGQPPADFTGQAPPSARGPAAALGGYPTAPPDFNAQPGFNTPPGYAPQPGAGTQPGAGPQGGGVPQYGPPGGYQATGDYGSHAAYAPQPQPGFGPPPGYPSPAGYAPSGPSTAGPFGGAGQAGFVPEGNAAGPPQEGYGPPPGMTRPNPYAPRDGYGPRGGMPSGGYGPPGPVPQAGPAPRHGFVPQNSPAPENGFGVQNGFAPQNGTAPQSGFVPQSGFGVQNGQGTQNGFGRASDYPPRRDDFPPPGTAGGPFPDAGQTGGAPWQQPGAFPGAQQPYGQVPPMGQPGYQATAQFTGQPGFGGGPTAAGAPQFPGRSLPGGPQSPSGPKFPGDPQLPGGPQFPGGSQFQSPPATQVQPGFGQRLAPEGPGGPMPGGPAPGGFGGPAVRRRITDAWARLGTLTPAAGLAAARRAGRNGDDPPADDRRPSPARNKALIAGAGVLAVIAVGGVIVAPKMLGGGSTDPGCHAYSGATLTAYNKAITDLNAQASQSVLSTDMSAAITGLTNAAGQAKSTSVKSALSGLLTELQTVNTGIKSGSVSASTVAALNAASAKADNAC